MNGEGGRSFGKTTRLTKLWLNYHILTADETQTIESCVQRYETFIAAPEKRFFLVQALRLNAFAEDLR
jgi:hypothetical protein